VKNILRQSGIDIIGDFPWGTHFCQFYQTKEDLIDILVPYFKAGLENNEFCMWITSEPLKARYAKQALKRAVKDLDSYIKKGQIEILDYSQWYTKTGEFDADIVLKGWVEKEQQALKNGFSGLRLTGNTFWLEEKDWEDFTDYEEKVNNVIGNYKMIAICTYSLDKCNALAVIDVVKNHQFALIKQGGKWKSIESSENISLRESLKESEAEYQFLFTNMIDGFAYHKILLDETGKPIDYIFLEVNDAFEKLTGLKREDLIGKRVTQSLPGIENDPADWIGIYGKVALTGETIKFENYSAQLDRWYSVSAYSPEREYFAAVFEDITDRKKAEFERENTIESLRLWEQTFNTIPDLVTILDNQHQIIRVNKAMANRLGLEPEQCTGLHCYEAVHGLSCPPEFCPHTITCQDSKEHVAEVQEPRLSGDFLVSTTPSFDEQGKLIGSIHVARDITERKQLENALKESEEKYRLIVETAQEGIVIGSPDGTFLFVNQRMADMLGYPKEEIIGKNGLDFLDKEQLTKVFEARKELAEGKESYGEFKFHRKDGSILWTLASSSSLYDSSGRHNLVIHSDITERKKREEELQRLNRTLKALSNSNQALMRATEESKYLEEICRIVIEDCGYVMAWINYAEDDEGKEVRPIAHAGFEEGYLEGLQVIWADTEQDQYPTGTAIRTGKPSICKNIFTDPKFKHWRKEAKQLDYASLISLPLMSDGKAFGALTIYSKETDAFSEDEIKLLDELAKDLSYGITAINLRAAHAQAEEEIEKLARFPEENPHPILRITNDGIMIYSNKVGLSLLGPLGFKVSQPLPDPWRELVIDVFNSQSKRVVDAEFGNRIYTLTIVPIADSGYVNIYGTDVTERKQAEKALRESEMKYRTIFDSSPIGIQYLDANGILSDCNDIAVKLLESSKEKLIGIDVKRVNNEGVKNAVFACLSGKSTHFEGDYLSIVSRKPMAISATYSPIISEDGSILGVIVITEDITQRKQAEKALKESEERLSTVLKNSSTVLAHLDRDLRYTWVYNHPDYPPEQILGKHSDEIMPDPNRTKLREIQQKVLESGVGMKVELPFKLATGVEIFDINIEPLRDASGNIIGLTTISMKVTELRRTEMQLRELGERYVLLFELTPDGVMTVDADGKIVSINPAGASILGYEKPEDVIDVNLLLTYPEQMRSIVRELLNKDYIENYEIEAVKDNGIPVYIIISCIAHKDDEGDITRYEAIFKDITERKMAEIELEKNRDILAELVEKRTYELNIINEQMRLTNAYNRGLIEASLDPLVTISPDGMVSDVNAATEKVTGCSRDELIGTSFSDYFTEPEKAKGGYERVFSDGSVWDYALEIRHKDGHITPVLYNATVYRDESGEVIGVFAAARDITERKQVEIALEEERASLAQRVNERTAKLSIANAELERANRLKDEFMASMSHELRTPINSILSISEVLSNDIFGKLNKEQLKALTDIDESGRHLLDLINDILDISKITVGQLGLEIKPVFVKQVCEAGMRLIEREAQKKHLRVSTSFDSTVTIIKADERRLRQMLVNLLSNSVKFTPDGGSIGLEVIGYIENEQVEFTIWDTGIGISQEQMSKLFQPFVQLDSRLSRRYSGTGLGLALTRQLVELHNGSISVKSEPGKGSRFTLSLPWKQDYEITDAMYRTGINEPDKTDLRKVSSLQTDSPKALFVTDSGESINPLVLLVDDSEISIKSISAYLSAKGCQVIAARNGMEAIQQAREAIPNIILMDIQMPDMDGLEAIQIIRADEDLAHIPIIALTALAMPGDREMCLSAGADEYISKPVSLSNLVKVIASKLNE